MDSLKTLKRQYPKTYKLLQRYLNLGFGKAGVSCPYWMNNIEKGIRGPFSGKGLPGQLVSIAEKRAKRQKINLYKLDNKEVVLFLKQNRIGVDCSGFAYNLLNSIDKEKGGNGIADDIFGIQKFDTWNPAWRAGASVLTGGAVSHEVKTKNIRIGDMVRADHGNHVMVIVDVSEDVIKYAHSSKLLSKRNGVHVSTIVVKNWNKDLSNQEWGEDTSEDNNIKEKYFSAKKGDGLRRFNWW